MNYKKMHNREQKLKATIQNLKAKNEHSKREILKLNNTLDDVMHEMRRFSADIISITEELSKNFQENQKSSAKWKKASEKIDTVFYLAGFISVRLSLADIELNPEAIKRQKLFRAGIHRKFEKSRHVLSSLARTKAININLTGESFSEIDAIKAFDLVPYVLLENAIKYSPKGQSINIIFDDNPSYKHASVTVSSIGPLLHSDEKEKVFDRGYQGQEAKDLNIDGQGLGLNLAKTLCDLHDLKLDINPSRDVKFTYNSIAYSEFQITITWNKRQA
ncbi:ATP-binding protein [Halomonas salipaludis]|uniref:histidine kinase n=1 Tax=Halomonas salipaludis TaxID=2032625 RepID=A0A2A2ERN4_9GAMM|nr:ATP-binding protein [Halomonas salipaludis]PAU74943.1 hypothetical protein CK498_20520 [Halomonas salipaludis]